MDKLQLRKRNIVALDAFRALAILLVCIYHMGIKTPFYPNMLIYHAGWIGVPLFFILSGFLLSLDFIEAGQQNISFPSVSDFYLKRIFRIFPLYYLGLFIYIVYRFIYKELPPIAEIVPHFFFLHNFESTNSAIYGPFWSLAVEVQVYLLFPLFGYVIYKTLKEKNYLQLSLFLLILVLLPFGYRAYVSNYYSGYNEQRDYIRFIYASTLSNLDSFGFGITGALIYSFNNQKSQIKTYYSYLLLIISLLIIFGLMHFTYKEDGWLLSEGILAPALYYSLLNSGWLLMILSALSMKGKIINNFFSSDIIRLISLTSFSMYVWHGIVFDGVRKVLHLLDLKGMIYNISYLTLGLFILILVSYFSWKLWEFRFLEIRRLKRAGILNN